MGSITPHAGRLTSVAGKWIKAENPLASSASLASQAKGVSWLESGQTAVLNVPSAVVPAERNYLLNPRHSDFTCIVLGQPQLLQTDT